MSHYDVIIIGAGTAGLSARDEVARRTRSYLVIDEGPLGTTCARVGCMPSKVLIEAAKIFHSQRKLPTIGASAPAATLDTAKLMQHVRKLRDRFTGGVVRSMDEWKQDHFLAARATLVDGRTVEAGGGRLTADKIFIATGSQPVVPAAWKAAGPALVTTDQFFELPALPERCAVIGVGAIGLEIAQALAHLGLEVSLFGDAKRLGGLSDPELVSYAREHLAQDLEFISHDVEKIEAAGMGAKIYAGGKVVEAELVLAAVGRRPRVEGLGLERLGKPLNKHGLPELEPETFRVPGTNVHLLGDVNAHRPILHEASDQGRRLGAQVQHDDPRPPHERVRLAITYTDPQIAIVGASHAELVEQKANFAEGSVCFEIQGRALTQLENVGMLKVYGERHGGKILGAELYSPAAEHLAHLLAWAIEDEAYVFGLLQRPYYHPSLEEGLRTALRNLAHHVVEQPRPWSEARVQDPPAGSYCPE